VAGKARVHELAKELGVTSKDVLARLSEQGEFVKAVERLKDEGETVVMVAPHEQFDRLFDTIIAVKRSS
jgi:uncharacterized protein YidB (DUF937 family)